MIVQHLKTIIWLRWRLTVNQWKKGGTVNAIFGLILLVLGLLTAASSFFAALVIGVLALPKAEPDHLLLMWDLIVVVFLFAWVMGLVTELQRSEVLSLDRLLHLPISVSGAFLLNYLSSLVTLSLIIFVPTAVGLCLALTIVKGPAMLILFALLATFLLMVTAITHQLRGWLHLLMVNKRRRRTIIAMVTAVFILLVQLPNVINLAVHRGKKSESQDEYQVALHQLQQDLEAGKVDAQAYTVRSEEVKKQRDEHHRQEQQKIYHKVIDVAAVVSLVLPVGWLPYGARAAAQGTLIPGLLGSLAALGIGYVSLRRSYRTTLKLYTGGFNARQRVKKVVEPSGPAPKVSNFLERRLPWLPEPASVVAIGNLRSLMRAPEGKMLMLTPIILLALFGVMILSNRDRSVPEMVRPFLGLGAISVTMLCFVQLLCNAFGFDRDGFRALVLSPCRRQDILLGKNLAVAPLCLTVCGVGLLLVEIFVPMKFTHLLATFVQMVAGFLIYCMLGNLISIVAPSAISAGTLKPAKAKFATVVIHVFSALFSPVALLPAFAACGIELLLDQIGWRHGVPVYLLLSIVELACVVWAYRFLLAAQGSFLQQREQSILDAVTAKTQ